MVGTGLFGGLFRHMLRLLLVKRYSGDDETGVLERQHTALESYAAEQAKSMGAVMAKGPNGGWVEDETVSGGVNLDERKSLGQWLKPPLLDNWDVMVVTEQDRVTRDDLHWWAFVGKLLEWGKRLAVLDDPGLDLSTPNGRMIAGIKATQATNYREDVRKKQRNARASFREQQRYVGGWWPFGRRAAPRASGEGWEYVIDPVTSELAREMADRVLEGESRRSIAKDFNARGIPTSREHQMQTKLLNPGEKRKKPPRKYQWNESVIGKILGNPNLIGYPTHKGELIRKDGIPVKWWDEIIKAEKWMRLQTVLEETGSFRRGIRSNRSDLLGVVFCGCGRPFHFRPVNKRKRQYFYYRCATVNTRTEKCAIGSLSWTRDFVNNWVEEAFLFALEDVEIVTKKFKPGVNRDPEITSLKEAIDHLSGNLAELPAGGRAAKSVIEKINEYETKLDELEAEPVIPSTWEKIGTGETYGERWAKTEDWQERGNWLLRLGIRVIFSGTMADPRVHFFIPEDLKERGPDALAGGEIDVHFIADAESSVKKLTEKMARDHSARDAVSANEDEGIEPKSSGLDAEMKEQIKDNFDQFERERRQMLRREAKRRGSRSDS